MNIQMTVSPQVSCEAAAEMCLCENPTVGFPGRTGTYCAVCGGRVITRSIRAGEKAAPDELLDIRDAKENIRNTLTIQKKRKQDRAGELDFLLKRL